MSDNRSESIQISRPLLLSLVLALVGCLMVVAFLLGRQTAPQPVAGPLSPTASPNTVPVESSHQLEVADVPPPVAETPPPPPVAETPPPPPPVAEPAPPPPENAHAVASAQPTAAHRHPQSPPSPQVQQYLARVDAIMASTGDLGDPTQFATGVLGQGASGDASGFDSLLARTRKAQAELAKVHPPATCKEHYQLLQAQLAGSIVLLQGVKRATMSMDTSGLPALAAQGQAMQAKVARLQTLTERLKQSGP